MARGIVRQQDRVAIWHEAAQWADEQGNKSDLIPEQNAPPAEVAEPPQGAQKPAPKSNKFTIPANGLKKVLSDGVDKINYEPHSHPGVKNFVDTHPGFAKTYFKPHYQDALKEHFGPETDGGGSSYEKLKYHMPQEHHDALHTHEQAPPPKSNKFTTPANGLKKLLDQPHTETTHVTDWLSKHPGFQKTYMSPKYTDALKGHLGDKAYNELQEHLKAAQGGAQDQQQPTEKKPTKKWVGEGPEPGTESDFHPALQELGDMLGTKWGQNWKNLSDEELKPTLQQWQKTFQGGQPEKSQAIQQVLDKHFPGGLAPEDDPWHTGEVDEESLANAVGHSGDQDEIDNIKAQQPQKSFGEAVNEMFADQNIKNSVDELNGKTSEQQKEMIQKTVNAEPQYWDKLNKLYNDFFGEDAYNPHAVKPELAKSMGEYHGTDPDEYTGWIDSLNNDELKSFKDNPSAAGYAFNDYMQDMSGGDDDENDYYNEDDDPEYDEEDDDSELDDDSDDSPTQFNPQAFHNDWKKAFPQHTYLDNNVGPVEAKDELSAMIDEPEEDALGDPRAYGEGEYEEHYDQWMADKLKAQQLYDQYFPNDGVGAQGGAGYDKAMQIAKGIQALDPKTFDDDWVKDWTDENADSPEKQKKILQNLIEGQWAPEETEGYKALLQKHFGEGSQQGVHPAAQELMDWYNAPNLNDNGLSWKDMSPEQVKAALESKVQASTATAQGTKAQELLDKHFGEGERQPQSLGQKMQAINPAINAETFDKQSPEGQKDILQNVWAKDPKHGPAFQQLYDEHYGDVDEINGIKQQQDSPQSTNPWQNSADQWQNLANGIDEIFPKNKLPMSSMSVDDLKQKLEGWLEHLKDTPGHADNLAKLKALYDQNFGDGDIQAIKSQMPDLQGMEKDLADAFGGTAAASWMTNPDKVPDYLNTVAMGGGEAGALAKQLQEKYYGQGDQPQSGQPAGLKSFIEHHSGPNQVLAPDDPEWVDYWNKLNPHEQQEFAAQEQGQPAKDIPQSHVNHAQILDAYGEPTEDFMQWFAKTNDYPWGEKPADDKALLSMLANPENPWTKGKVQEYLKDQNTFPSEQYTGAEPLSAEELTKGLDWGDKHTGPSLGMQAFIDKSENWASDNKKLIQTPQFQEWFDSLPATGGVGYGDDSSQDQHPGDLLGIFKKNNPDWQSYEPGEQDSTDDQDEISQIKQQMPQAPEWNPQTFAEQYKEILPGSSSSLANGSVDPQKAFTKLTDLISAHPDSDKTPGLQKMLDHWFPTGAPEVAPVPGQPAQKKAPLPAGSTHYKALMKSVMDKAPHGAFSEADMKTFRSKKFQDWFDAAPPGYQKTLGPNPGIVIDDFDAGNYSAPVGGGEWGDQSSGKDKHYDVMGYPKSKNNEDLPEHLRQNPSRPGGEGIKFPRHEDEQETLPLSPGENFAPHYAPMPIYRLFPIELDKEPTTPGWVKGEKNQKLFVEQQKARLRRIDEIINGTNKARNTGSDTSSFNQWTKSLGLSNQDKTDLYNSLFAPVNDQPTLFDDDRWKLFEDKAKELGIAPEKLADLAENLDVTPGTPPKGNYDHPDLAELILDYAQGYKGHTGRGGLGTHWTRDKHKVYEGVGGVQSASPSSSRQLTVGISGLWSGQGEGSGEHGAFDPMDNSEREHNLEAGAPVWIRRLQIKDPNAAWHDLVDHGPISTWTPGRDETASGKTVRDKPSLAEELTKAIGGAHDADVFDKLKPGHKAEMLMGKIWKDHPDKRPQIEALYRDFFVGRPDLPTKPHKRSASLDRVRQTPKEIEARIIELEASYS